MNDETPEIEDIAEQKAVRLQKRARLIQDAETAGEGPYPVSVPITATIAEVRAEFPDLAADSATGEIVGVAGRGERDGDDASRPPAGTGALVAGAPGAAPAPRLRPAG